MRRKLIAGNWKMNGSMAALAELDAIAAAAAAVPGVNVAIAVPATLIASATERVPALTIGAQDVHQGECGAHTGCISATMVREVGAAFSIVGHSERRADQGESDAHVRGKAEAARAVGLDVILCVGERLEDRDAGRAEAIVTAQLAASLPKGATGDWLAVAYEPIWAIGTGRTPTVADVAAMHGALRAKLRDLVGDEAEKVRLLYGRSVNDANAADLLGANDVDGALVGGASLTAAKFVPIIKAAARIAS